MTHLKPIWKERNIRLGSKVRLQHSVVISIFLYACEWHWWYHYNSVQWKHMWEVFISLPTHLEFLWKRSNFSSSNRHLGSVIFSLCPTKWDFFSQSFINIKAESLETKLNHDTAAEKMSDKCFYAWVSKLLNFIWLNLMTLTWHLKIALINRSHLSG